MPKPRSRSFRPDVADRIPVHDKYDLFPDDALVKIALTKPTSMWSTSGSMAREELERRFRVEHGISRKQFGDDQWRTLFKLTYPTLPDITKEVPRKRVVKRMSRR